MKNDKITAREREALYADTFNEVTTAYRETRQLPPVGAINYDPAPASKATRLTAEGIHFAVDVENATTKAIGGDPKLESAWFRLVAGEPVDKATAKIVIGRCARRYLAHQLTPWLYFRNNRYKKEGTR